MLRCPQIVLLGSDGREYMFLAKPKDDLRKDHRMMEVASVINRLFAREPASRRRNLYLRRRAHTADLPALSTKSTPGPPMLHFFDAQLLYPLDAQSMHALKLGAVLCSLTETSLPAGHLDWWLVCAHSRRLMSDMAQMGIGLSVAISATRLLS